MITIPINVHHPAFLWQLDLFWHSHKKMYGSRAYNKAFSAIINQHRQTDIVYDKLTLDIPHQYCDPFFVKLADVNSDKITDIGILSPINMQIALQQFLNSFQDYEIIELVDHDMLHFRPHSTIDIDHDQFYVCDLYENWHLKSLSSNKHIISMYFENGGKYYNGGFVPIIGTVKTFKKILPEWSAIHKDIVHRSYPSIIHWWAGMFAFNAACEKKRVQMIAKDICYIPNVNNLEPQHYIAHYSVDPIFNKKTYPSINTQKFTNNEFYAMIKSWPNLGKII